MLLKRLASGLYVPPLLGFSRRRCCCGETPLCSNCLTADPDNIQVILAGIATPLADCAGLNGTYSVPSLAPAQPCAWIDDFTIAFIVYRIRVLVQFFIPTGTHRIIVSITGNTPIRSVSWQRYFGASKIDCAGFSDTDIPFQSASNCAGSSSTCKITAL